jgi:hypothetical protein
MGKALILLAFAAAQALPAARADDLSDRFATVWESLWTQEGSPTWVIRWAGEVRVRFTGAGVARFRDHAFGALQEATSASGLALRDVSTDADAADAANLEYQLVEAFELDEKMPCITNHRRWRNWQLEKVLIRVRARESWRCTHHEVMHAMGIRGHPSGKTVLSYFPYRPDELMDMDVLMLKAWYSPRMRAGATPFEALQILTDTVVETVPEGGRDSARAAQAGFLRARLQEMERYARGEGEVPTIVFRSGRGTANAMAAGRDLMAYFVGVAHQRGIGTAKDAQQGQQWVERAAEKGVPSAKNALEILKKAPGP